MSDSSIKKIENREDKEKTWKITNEKNNHYIIIVFSKTLEDDMKKNSRSFERLQIEQINEILKIISDLEHDYILKINRENIGKANMPLPIEKIKRMIEVI
nr:hypothetical protein [uncultured Ligilactobacillus sp.]